MTNKAHLRYMTNHQSVCWRPELLGVDFVLFDSVGTKSTCPDCYALLIAHNEKEYEMESNETYVAKRGSLLPVQACAFGILFSSVFWLTLALAAWLTWLR